MPLAVVEEEAVHAVHGCVRGRGENDLRARVALDDRQDLLVSVLGRGRDDAPGEVDGERRGAGTHKGRQ